jgi:hypothetical protein
MIARLVALVAVCVGVAVLTGGCGRERSELERIALPARFDVVRDTAQWIPEFDPVWWKAIDAAYAEYDADVERIARERWEPFAREMSMASQRARAFDPDDARAWRSRQRSIDDALAQAERAFIAQIDVELPDGADRFIALLAARVEWQRASAVWSEASRPLPGPLEELSRVGVHAGDDATVPEATEIYRVLARDARRLANERTKAYLDWTEDFVTLDATLREMRANSPNGAGRQVDRAQRALDRRLEAMRAVRAETTEELRMKLLAAGDRFARAIADDTTRAEFVERVEADLHEGMSTTRTMEMYARLAERVILRAKPDDPALIEAFRADVARGLELQRTKRARLRSDDPAERTAAYKELSAMPGAIIESARTKLDDRLSGRLFWQAVRVDLGQVDEDAAFAAIFADDPPRLVDPSPADATDALTAAAGGAQQLVVYGSGLSPRVLRVLAAGLGIEGEGQVEFDAIVADETVRLSEALQIESKRVEEAVRSIDRRGEPFADRDQMRSAVGELMGIVRGAMAATLAANRAANERVIGAGVRVAGASGDEPVVAEARLELELLARIGSRGLGQRSGRGELEGIAGATVECHTSPLAVARLMDVSDGERDAAIALILTHAEELIAQADAARAGMLENLADFLRVVASGERAAEFGVPPWRAKLAAPGAVELRFAIVDEIETVLGPEVALAYGRCWRRLERPELEPARIAAIARIESMLGAPGVDPVTNSLLSAILIASEASRDEAVRTTHRWRAARIVGERMDSADQWRNAAPIEPVGALLFSRIRDGDERAVALCHAAARFAGADEALAEALVIRERPIVRTLRPR